MTAPWAFTLYFLCAIFVFSPDLAAVSAGVREKSLLAAGLQNYTQRNFEASRKNFQELTAVNPRNALYWFNLGNSNFMLGKFSEAELAFYKVEQLRSPLANAATLYRAKAQKEQGKGQAARQALQTLLRRPKLTPAIREAAMQELMPGNSEALSLYQQGKYKRAWRLLAREKNKSEDAQLLQAMILIKLDREDRALQILDRLKATPELRALSSDLKERIRDTYSRPQWLFVEAAAGYDSNPYGAPDADGSAAFLAGLGGGGRLWSKDLWYWNAGYIGRWNEVTSHSDLRALSHELNSSLGREVSTDLFQIMPFVSHESWDGNPARLSLGTRIQLRVGPAKEEYGIEGEIARDSALDDDLSYLSGSRIKGRLFAGRILFPVYGQVYLEAERQAIGDQRYSSTELLPMAHKSLSLGSRVLWRFQPSWTMEMSGSYSMRDYSNSTQPGDKARKDGLATLTGVVTKLFSDRLSAYASLSYTNNKSTLDAADVSDQNYSQVKLLTGIVLDAL